jgi:ABC-type sugar transport system ATPase subunit
MAQETRWKAKLVVLDEPTAALSVLEQRRDDGRSLKRTFRFDGRSIGLTDLR